MPSEPDTLTFKCPNCGAPVSGNERTCGYCRAALASRRCVHCFNHDLHDARHCSACGREHGLEPIGEASPLTCPACRATLSAFEEPAGTVFDCARCCGHFVEHALLRSLIEQRAELARSVPARPIARNNPFGAKVSYRSCPRCQALMHRKNFAGSSGVVVDVCTKHGIWFDAGELPTILAFVESGGLERERLRAEERARQAKVEQRLAATPPAMANAQSSATTDIDLFDIVNELLDLVRKVLR
ncbi:MAG: zf-TFIIB domain-containing protein [Myxococcota bacterium]